MRPSGRSLRRAALSGLALLLATAPAPATAAPKPSKRVRDARESVARIIKATDADKKQAATEKNAAFAIDKRGDFLTADGPASRAGAFTVQIGGRSAKLDALPQPSDATPGLALIHVDGAPSSVRPLPMADKQPVSGQRLWIVPPAGVRGGIQGGTVQQYCPGRTPDLIAVKAAPGIPGLTGSPVLNSAGEFVGVVRKRQPDPCFDDVDVNVIKVVPARVAIHPVAEARPEKRADFPAVPVVIVLALLLMLANVYFLMRRRSAVGDPMLVARPSSATPGATAPDARVYPVEDDLEITLRPKTKPAPPPAKDDDIGPITLR